MFILPLEFAYKTSIRAWLTWALVVLMLFIHWRVEVNKARVEEDLHAYCHSERGEAFTEQLRWQSRVAGESSEMEWRCETVLTVIAHGGNRPEAVQYLLDHGELDELSESQFGRFAQTLESGILDADMYVPRLLQEKLAQPGQSWNPVRMLTSTFAHADWMHVIFNMVFLIAFGSILEVVVGPIVYVGFILASALTTGIAYAAVTTVTGDDFTLALGFSGADFALLGALLYLMPFAPIKSIVFIGILPIPMRLGVWVFGLIFLGGELWFLFDQGPFDESSGVNVLAHAVGGVTGFVLAAWFLQPLRRQLQDILGRAERQEWSQR